MPNTAPTPHRRWFRFSLRTLFVVVTVLACWLGWNLHVVRQRQAMMTWINEHDGRIIRTPPTGVMLVPSGDFHSFPNYRRHFGDEPVYWVVLGQPLSAAALAHVRAVFPEAFVVPPVPLESGVARHDNAEPQSK